ncbi:MAG: S8 family serine peptidase, partial [Gemmatimonadaceae bacterium]
MRRFRSALVAAAGVVLAACSTPDRIPTSPVGSIETNSRAATAYLVTFQDDVTDVEGLANEMSRGRFALDNVRKHAARGFTAHIPPAFVDAVRLDPRVKIFEPDGVVTLDLPRVAARPPGGGGGQQVSYGLTRVGGSGDGTGKTAWIIDTGVDLDHPDLNTSRNCHANFASGSSPNDGHGHGTHVSGTIG